MEDIELTSLAERLKSGRCILVLGPEICADWPGSQGGSNAPTQATCADGLKERLAEELRKKGIDSSMAGSLAAVAQLYEDRGALPGLGAENLRVLAAQYYASLRLKPSKDHKALASLPFPLIVSTCHDQLLTAALSQAEKPPLVYRFDLSGTAERDGEEKIPHPAVLAPVLYHLFGKSDEPQTLVLSENDLLDFVVAMVSDRPSPLPDWLRKELQAPGVGLLFIGFDVSHWYQRILVKALIRFLSGGRSRSIGATALDPRLQSVPDPERTQTILFYQRGHRVEVSDESIAGFVSDLQQRIKTAGGVTAKVRRPKVFVSYAKENDALAKAVFDVLKEAGIDPWLDVDGLRGGQDWDERIKEELRRVDYVLVLVTPELVRKTVGFVNTEIARALNHGLQYQDRFVIPLVSKKLPKDERVPALRDKHEIEFDEDQPGAVLTSLAKELLREVQRRNR